MPGRLHVLRQRANLEVAGLLTTLNEAFDRVAMHAVRRELVETRSSAVGLPLIPVLLPYPCTNEVYEHLQKTRLYERNKRLQAPVEFVRVAVISPETSAGLGDFRSEADLLESAILCEFRIFPATVHGVTAPRSTRLPSWLSSSD